MTLTKAHIAKTIHDRLHFTNDRSTQLVDSILEILKKTLENGEDVLISGFGKFWVKNKRERRGRNPATGERLLDIMDFVKYGLPVTILAWLVFWFWTVFGYWKFLSW